MGGQELEYGSDFHDVTIGDNTWDQSLTNFFAGPGYDLCTGWGTPAGAGLINALVTPDFLQIVPPAGFNTFGGAGGPFTKVSQTLTLTNAGTGTISWTLANPALWLTASPTSGTLAPGATALVTASLNAAAGNLEVGTYTNTVWFTNLADSAAIGRQYTLSVLAPPAITNQPSSQAVPFGATAVFSVAASGAQPLFYQWWADGTSLTDGGNISGSATSILTINNVSPASVGSYSVTVSNTVLTVASQAASLSITPSAPVIFQQPASQTMPPGTAVWFTVGAYGDPPSYQWTFDGTNLPGATGATLVLTNIQINLSGIYAVAITNAQGGSLSSNAILTVVPGFMGVATFDEFNLQAGYWPALTDGYDGLNWSNFLVINGVLEPQSGYRAGMISASDVAFNGSGDEASLSQSTPFNLLSAYLTAAWNDNLLVEAKGYLGGTVLYDSTFTLSATAPTNVVFNFLGVTEVDFISSGGTPSPDYGGKSGTQFAMDNMVVTEQSGSPFNTTPVICNFGPASLMLAQGQDASLVVAAVGQPPLAYQWRMNGTNLTGQTSTVLNLTNVQPAMTGNYTVIVTNIFGATTSGVAAVTIAAVAPQIIVPPQDRLATLGDTAGFSVSASGWAPLSYQWQFMGTNTPDATGTNYTLPDVAAADAGGYDVMITNNYGSVTSRMAVLTVVSPPGVINYEGQPLVFFPAPITTNYVLQMTTNATCGSWVTVTGGVPFSGLQITNTPGTAFFRLNLTAQTVTQIAAGGYHSIFLKNDGSLWAMGDNVYGQLGDGTFGIYPNYGSNHLEQIVASNVTAIAAGYLHSLFLKSDGSLWTMGDNHFGESGDDTYSTNSSYNGINLPEKIVASNAIAISAGYIHNLFMKNDGSLWAMGEDYFGQLGDGAYNNTNRPEQIEAGAALTMLELGISTYGSQPVVLFPTVNNLNCWLLLTTNLASGNWTAVTNGTPFGGLEITNAPSPVFFRLY